jgi:RND family efflux transporter MFP subunit
MSPFRQRLLLLIVVGCGCVCGWGWGLAWVASGAEPAGEGAVAEPRGYRGYVAPARQQELIMPTEGTLQAVPVVEGQRVRAGDLLARADDRVQQAVVKAAAVRAEGKAELERARLVQAQASLRLEKVKTTFNQGASTPLEVQEAELELGQAKAGVALAQEAIDLAKASHALELRRLELHELRAPFDGVVVKVNREAGAAVTSQDKVLVLADLGRLKAVVNLPVALYARMKVGEVHRLLAGSPIHRELRGKVLTLDPIFDTASQTFRCVLEVANPELGLPAGFTVDLLPPEP